MTKNRLEAFSDGVIAIALTIMVLELKVPEEISLESLMGVLPHFLGYALSFLYIAIYWNNHHHMLHTVRKVNGATLWANNHLLFWLTMVPFATAVVGEHPLEALPLALYSFVLLLSGFAYYVLAQVIAKQHGPNAEMAAALGLDWKGPVSLVGYLAAFGFSFVAPLVTQVIIALGALLWFIPDRRIERHLEKHESKD
ncbi:MAG: TMEM175 family protein [Spirochaetales bacterium]